MSQHMALQRKSVNVGNIANDTFVGPLSRVDHFMSPELRLMTKSLAAELAGIRLLPFVGPLHVGVEISTV